MIVEARRLPALGRIRGAVSALAMIAIAAPVLAGPQGGSLRGGSARISTSENVTTIEQSGQRIVIDWESFDVKADEVVRFIQPGRDAIALNRVMNGLPSHIRGTLLANGNVWLTNPSGVMFHAGSVVDVGGIIATTAGIDPDKFMSGQNEFDRPGDPNAKVVNEGSITFADAGLAGLVAPQVENHGVIAGKLGRIVIAGHESFSVDISGDGLFEIDLRDADPKAYARVTNSGRLAAEAGTIIITAAAARGAVNAAVSIDGIVEAKSARLDGGAIVLDGGEGRVAVSGDIDASGRFGGRIQATGDEVHLAETARLDASGDQGGGMVEVGGVRDENPTELGEREARRVSMERGARVLADAGGEGDGGDVTFWSSDATVVFGDVFAQGGEIAGRGGFVEISSRGALAFDGSVNAGSDGLLLLDPRDVLIGGEGGSNLRADLLASEGAGADFHVSASSLAIFGADLTIQAERDIIVEPGGRVDNSEFGASLSLEAGRDIVLHDDLLIAGGLSLMADAPTTAGAADNVGAIRVIGGRTLAAPFGALELSAPEGLDGSAMAATDTLVLQARSEIILPGAFVAGGLRVQAAGDIAAPSGLQVSGDARISAFDSFNDNAAGSAVFGDVALDAPGTSIGGVLSMTGDFVRAALESDAVLADIWAREGLEVSATGSLSLDRAAIGDGPVAFDTKVIEIRRDATLAAGGPIAIRDIQARNVTLGGPGTAAGAPTASPDGFTVADLLADSLSLGSAGGPLSISGVSLLGSAVLGSASSFDIRQARFLDDLHLETEGDGEIVLDGVAAPSITLEGGTVRLGAIETETLDIHAGAGGISPIATAGGGGGLITVEAPALPQRDAGDGPVIEPASDFVAPFEDGLFVTGDALFEAIGFVRFGRSEIGGDLTAISGADKTVHSAPIDIEQEGPISVGGQAVFIAGDPNDLAHRGDIDLDDHDNAFGELLAVGRNARLRDVDGFTLLAGLDLAGLLYIGDAGSAQPGDVRVEGGRALGGVEITTLGGVDISGLSTEGTLVLRTAEAVIADSVIGDDALLSVEGNLAWIDLTIGGDAMLSVGEDLTIRRASVGSLDAAVGGGADIREFDHGGAGISTGGLLHMEEMRGGDLVGNAGGDILARSISGGDLELKANDDLDGESILAASAVLDAGARLSVAGIEAETIRLFSGGGMDLTDAIFDHLVAESGRNASLTLLAGGDLEASAEGDLLLSDAELEAASLDALNDISLVRLGGESLFAVAGGDVTGRDVDIATLGIEAAGEISITRLEAGNADFTGGDIELENALFESLLAISESALQATRLAIEDGAQLESAGTMRLSEITAGGALSARSGLGAGPDAVSLALANLRASALDADADGSIDLDGLDIGGDAVLRARDGSIAMGSLKAAGALKAVADNGDIITRPGSAVAPAFEIDRAIAPGDEGAAPETLTVAETAFANLLGISGGSWLDAAGDVRLPHDTTIGLLNDFGGPVSISAGEAIAIATAGDLGIGAGATELPGIGTVTRSGLFNRAGGAPSAIHVQAGGELNIAESAEISASGDALLSAGTGLRLDQPLEIGGALSLSSGGDAYLFARDDLQLGPSVVGGHLELIAEWGDGTNPASVGQRARIVVPALDMAETGASEASLRRSGGLAVAGATRVSTDAPLDAPLADAGGDIILDQSENVFGGRVSFRRIFGDLVLAEEAGAVTDGRPQLRIANLEIAGDAEITTSDDVIFLGPLTTLRDGDRPAARLDPPASASLEDRLAQGDEGLTLNELRQFIPNGKVLRVDTTAGGNDPAGGLIRFDRPIDGSSGLRSDRSIESITGRADLGALTLEAGREGDVRLRHYIGAASPIGPFEVRSAGDISLGHTYARRDPGPEAPETRFLLGRGDGEEIDILVTGEMRLNASGSIRIFTPQGLLQRYEAADDYYGLNTPALIYGEDVVPESLSLFGFIGNTSRKAAGLLPSGPREDGFVFNGCVVGDVEDCTGLSRPRVILVTTVDNIGILNVDTEDLFELFVSYGNEELWGVPPGYFPEFDVDDVREQGNRQIIESSDDDEEEEEEEEDAFGSAQEPEGRG